MANYPLFQKALRPRTRSVFSYVDQNQVEATTILTVALFGQPAPINGVAGGVRVSLGGNSWSMKYPLRVWSGLVWVQRPVKSWNGLSWVLS